MGKARKTAVLKALARTWGEWTTQEPTDEIRRQHPHLKHCKCIWANNRYEVQGFICETSIGGVWQLTVLRHGDLEKITYGELQRIIHELFGENMVAVEVYPKMSDEWQTKTNLTVLWLLPASWSLPFGLQMPNAWGKPQQEPTNAE